MHFFKVMQIKKLFLLWLAFITLVIVLYLIIFQNGTIDEADRLSRLYSIDQAIHAQSKVGCKQPYLPVNAPDIMKFIKSVPKINCSSADHDWVKCTGFECTVQDEARNKYGPIKCSFTDIIRTTDYKNMQGETTTSNFYYKLEKSDVVHVYCTSENRREWSATLTGIRFDKTVMEDASWETSSDSSLKMNVLMFGFDSLSRNAFIRKLPKTYDYLTEVLHTIVLEGYNIVGDGTPQALIPILTGKTELELPDTRKRYRNTKFVDVYPFIWKNYKEAGYVTAFYEDVPQLSTFTYRLNGFDKAPTDHYMRPYYLASLEERHKWPKFCTGDTPRHNIMFNSIKDFFMVYKSKPKFLFGFHGELSHDDYNLIETADDDMVSFLTSLKDSNALNNTILIIMADHGHRFAEIRNTIQGKQEERLPFFSFAFPDWFKRKHQDAYNNFKSNSDKLVTPFDIFTTLKSALTLDNVGVADIEAQRSVSLFLRIPEERSCAHAYIEPHWCACLDWKNIPIHDSIVKRLAEVFVETLNNLTKSHRDICSDLSISEIHWVTKMMPNENLIKFNKNADRDGFVADLSAKMKLKTDMYQIKVMLVPGNSLFEASLTHYLDSNKIDLKLSDISRINMYGSQARCVEKTLPHLRKYCFCK